LKRQRIVQTSSRKFYLVFVLFLH